MDIANSTTYKARWQIELFFKWIKQNLEIKSFFRTSKSAVLIRVWIALCVYLLISYMKFVSKSKRSKMQILRLPETNLFEKWLLADVVSDKATEKILINSHQMGLVL